MSFDKSSSMTVKIREARRGDFKQVRRFVQELAFHEKMPYASQGPDLTEAELERDAFDLEAPLFYCFVAEDPNDASKIIGYALFHHVYSVWVGTRMFLRDLFVADSHRGTGLGRDLFVKVVERAEATNCIDMEWLCRDSNSSKHFYEKLGGTDVTIEEEWQQYRMDRESMLKLVAN